MLSFYLIGLMVAIFFMQMIPGVTEALIFDPLLALSQPWRFLTSMFVHEGVEHLFFNMLAMLMFAPILERRIGAIKLLLVFIAAGIIGSVLYYATIVTGFAPPVPALGASGGIYGILGAMTVLTPNLVVYVMFFPMRMREAAAVWIILELLGTFNPYSGIASAAHLGGLIFGILYARHMPSDNEENIVFYK